MSKSIAIECHRVYDPLPSRGYRVLVDRIWPRGVSKKELKLDEWCRDLAPSSELRKWFDHDPDKWREFQRRYRAELKSQRENIDALLERCEQKPLLLLYGARDTEHNNAVALKSLIASSKRA